MTSYEKREGWAPWGLLQDLCWPPTCRHKPVVTWTILQNLLWGLRLPGYFPCLPLKPRDSLQVFADENYLKMVGTGSSRAEWFTGCSNAHQGLRLNLEILEFVRVLENIPRSGIKAPLPASLPWECASKGSWSQAHSEGLGRLSQLWPLIYRNGREETWGVYIKILVHNNVNVLCCILIFTAKSIPLISLILIVM